MGNAYGTPSDKQKHNAEIIYNLLRVFGYNQAAACGILGNMQLESGISSGALESGTAAALPGGGEHFSDLTNAVMLSYCDPNDSGYGTGLIQWDGYTSTPPAGNQVASFASRYNSLWYDAEIQVFKLEAEYIYDPSGWGGVNGVTYQYWTPNRVSPPVDWSVFKTYPGTPEDCADIFRECRERSSGDPSGKEKGGSPIESN